MAIEWVISFLLLGAFVGVFAGMLGIGGGGILVPVLGMIFAQMGFAEERIMHLALGTSIASIIATSFASMRAHHSHSAVLWPIVKRLTPGIIVGTLVATYFAAHISNQILVVIFAVFMAYLFVQMFFQKQPDSSGLSASPRELVAAGGVIGGISALVSIGGGALTVPYLVWRNCDVKKAIGTSSAVGFPISIMATIGYAINGWHETDTSQWIFGFVYVPAVLLIAITSTFTAPLGAKLAHKLPVKVLKRVLGALILVLSLKLLWQIWG